MYRQAFMFFIIATQAMLLSCAMEPGQTATEINEPCSELFEADRLRLCSSEEQLSVTDGWRPQKSEGLSSLNYPIDRVACSSTTQLAYFQALDALDKVVACPWLDQVTNAEVQAARASDQLMDITQGGTVNLERLLSAKPQVFLYNPQSAELVSRISQAGVVCIPFVEYAAHKPIERAAWLQAVGLIAQESAEAERMLDQIADLYMTAQAPKRQESPTVLLASVYQGVWSAAGGQSLMSNMLRDAGARYGLEGENKSSVDLNMEQLSVILPTCDWLGILHYGEPDPALFDELRSRLGADALAELKLFYCNTAESDYFGKALLEPQVLLDELRGVLEKRDMPDYRYFHRLRTNP